jgi:hypothetical protein
VQATLVLLRSDQSVALGVKWFLTWERNIWSSPTKHGRLEAYEGWLVIFPIAILLFGGLIAFVLIQLLPAGLWHSFAIGLISQAITIAVLVGTNLTLGRPWILVPVLVGVPISAALGGAIATWDELELSHRQFVQLFSLAAPSPIALVLGIFMIAAAIRIGATLRYIGQGLRNLPQNFRRLVLCTSPRQEPELVPGLPRGSTEMFTLPDVLVHLRRNLASSPPGKGIWAMPIRLGRIILMVSAVPIWFVPGWLYRVTLKSTVWFWWPLAFLGGDLRQTRYPELFQEKLTDTLWAKTSIILAVLTVATFIVSNFFLSGVVFQANPFLSVLGFVFVVDWSLRPWQILAVTAALISIGALFWIDNVARDYRFATERRDGPLLAHAERRFGRIERLLRFRLLLLLAFWLLVGVHTVLYFNSTKCWFNLSDNVEGWAQWVYGDRFPPAHC